MNKKIALIAAMAPALVGAGALGAPARADYQVVCQSPCVNTAPYTQRVSVSTWEQQAHDNSNPLAHYGPAAVSGNARYVAFASDAANLVAQPDTNGKTDVFVRDRSEGTTTRVSVATGGAQSDGISRYASISGDGRYVAFESNAANLVAGNATGNWEVYRHDRFNGTTTLVSVATSGQPAPGCSRLPSISDDGRYVAFSSTAPNLVDTDYNGKPDVFVRDMLGASTTRESLYTGGGEAYSGSSYQPSISAHGEYVAFATWTAFTPEDTNNDWDVYVRDRIAGTTTLVSLGAYGAIGNGGSDSPAISDDGKRVVFNSLASNLNSLDTNGNWDVFLRDLEAGKTSRVSAGADNATASTYGQAAISGDGLRVAFSSTARFSPDDSGNWMEDIYVRDLPSGTVTRASVPMSGMTLNNYSAHPGLSFTGAHVAFTSFATTLVENDTNQKSDVFLRKL